MVQLLSISVTEPLLNLVVDASPVNMEKEPHSLSIPLPSPQSTISSSIVMIDNLAFSNYPSLQLRKEPTLQTVNSPSMASSFLDLLNTDSPTIEKIKKIFTSIDNITPTYIISSTDKSPLTDIPHPLIITTVSMDIHQSIDIPSPSELISQTLLGLREESDLVSEGQVFYLSKGEA